VSRFSLYAPLRPRFAHVPPMERPRRRTCKGRDDRLRGAAGLADMASVKSVVTETYPWSSGGRESSPSKPWGPRTRKSRADQEGRRSPTGPVPRENPRWLPGCSPTASPLPLDRCGSDAIFHLGLDSQRAATVNHPDEPGQMMNPSRSQDSGFTSSLWADVRPPRPPPKGLCAPRRLEHRAIGNPHDPDFAGVT
jgi:hypothetical protein